MLNSFFLAVAIALAFSFASSGRRDVAAAQNPRPDQVTIAKPAQVTLQQYESPFDASLGLLVGEAHRDITLHEFTEELSDQRVLTTGNSITFRLDGVGLPSTLITGTGAKRELPILLAYEGGRVAPYADLPRASRSNQLLVTLYSASLRQIEARRNFSVITAPKPAELNAAKRAYSQGSDIPTQTWGVTYSGRTYCGFEMFRSEQRYKHLNDAALALIAAPFDEHNLFAEFDKRGTPQRYIYCVPGPTRTTCSEDGFFNVSTPYSISFDAKLLCEVDNIAPKAMSWFSDRVVSRTIASK